MSEHVAKYSMSVFQLKTPGPDNFNNASYFTYLWHGLSADADKLVYWS